MGDLADGVTMGMGDWLGYNVATNPAGRRRLRTLHAVITFCSWRVRRTERPVIKVFLTHRRITQSIYVKH
jgi:hypothetical protein